LKNSSYGPGSDHSSRERREPFQGFIWQIIHADSTWQKCDSQQLFSSSAYKAERGMYTTGIFTINDAIGHEHTLYKKHVLWRCNSNPHAFGIENALISRERQQKTMPSPLLW
jgi:hypothetical protein